MTICCRHGNVLSSMSIRLAALGTFVGIALTASIGVWPSVAQAFIVGRYQVEACTEAVAFKNNIWTASTNNGDLETHTSCGEPPAPYQSTTTANLEITDMVALTKEIPVGAEGAWEVKAPAGETIAEVTGYSSLFRNGGNAWQVYRESETTNNEITIEQTCKGVSTDSCGIGGLFQATGLQARRFAFTARCEAEEYEPGKFFTTCPDGALLHDVRAGINYATVTLEDLTPPANITASSIPTGPQHGTISIQGSAEDPLAGLLSLSIINSEGQTVAGPVSVPGGCDYSNFTPCPTSTAGLTVPVDTEKLPEGTDQLRLVATNAAHDEGHSEPFTIDVDNHPAEEPHSGKSGSEEKPKPKEPSTGSSQTGNTPGDGNNGEQGQQEQKSASKPLPALHLRLDRPHIHQHHLTLSGTTQASARGWLRLIFRFRGRRRYASLARRAAIHDGRFTAHFSLPLRCPDKAEVRVEYAGDSDIHATRSSRRVRLPACRL